MKQLPSEQITELVRQDNTYAVREVKEHLYEWVSAIIQFLDEQAEQKDAEKGKE